MTSKPAVANRRMIKWVLMLALIALMLRIGAVVGLRAWEHPNAMEHAELAGSLVGGKGLSFNAGWGYYGPSAIASPTYPLILAGLFYVFGSSTTTAFVVAMAINALFGAATVVMLYPMAREIGARPVVAMLACTMLAFWPTQVYLVAHAQPIAMLTACVVGAIWMFNRAARTGSVWNWLAFSVFGCLGALTEPVFLPAMFLIGCFMLVWRTRPWHWRLRNAAILLLVAVALQGPWIARNYSVYGTFVPTKSGVWCNFWKSANPHATGSDRLAIPEGEVKRLQGLSPIDAERHARRSDTAHQYAMLTREQNQHLWGKNEVEQDALFRAWALQWLAENPVRYAQLCGIRFLKTVWVEWDNPKSRNIIYVLCRSGLLVASLGGLVLALRRGWRMGHIFLLMGTCLLTYTLVIAAARFALPHEPVQLVLSALLVIMALDWLRGRTSTGGGAPGPGAESD